jgi:putative ATP-dependent endonuclease of OLD family
MRLKAIVLENFRRYRDRTYIPIDQLTAFIGRNDAGKSTILEALDIFFEGDTVKIEPGDACTSGDAKNVRISAVFDDLPKVLDLDRGARTTLEAEHLLNASGDLEIIKVYNCSIQKVGAPKVFAHALHPTAPGVSDLLQKGNSDLKKLVKEKGLEDHCNLNNNPSMRQALYSAAGDLNRTETDVPLNEADGKNIWEAVKDHLPVYALFRSDRVSSDQDPEVQNPMKLAIQSALANLTSELSDITRKVEEIASETAARTLEHLRASFPDLELASVLKPQFRKPNWSTVFKLDLESDDNIPLNKRGSGVRRLVLLSFFQAEAARLREEKQKGQESRLRVIYAIEEPETSQHPDSQERIIRAFCNIAEAGEQVILTTHVPGLARLLPTGSLRFVDTDPASGQVRARPSTDEVLSEIAESLGVLPEPTNKPGVKVAVAVEGPTDIDALVSFATVLSTSGDLPHFDQSKVFWTIGGGTTLRDWIERRYLDSLGIPQVFLFDSDRTSAVLPLSQDKEDRAKELNTRPNCQAFVTRKREIDNYVHPDAIDRVSNGKISLPGGIDLDYCDIPNTFKAEFERAKNTHGKSLGFYPDDHNGNNLGIRSTESNCKRIISAYIMRNMTRDEVIQRGACVDDQGNQYNEIIEWLTSIQGYLA